MLTLPNSSFVPVVAQRLAQPNIVWFDRKRASEQELRTHAFCIPQPYEAPEGYSAEERMLYADRYGGSGIGRSGGSGRCGTYAGVQVKGVGRTPLVTPQENWVHTTGTLCLSEAAAEAIWAQILARTLPYGAVPAYGIVLTGGVFRREYEPGQPPRHRALLFRQFALRPAHYLRNLHFQFGPPQGELCEDAICRRNAIRTLAQALELHYGDAIRELVGIQKINLGLILFARRCAAQLAASFARRIFHGSLTPSNISVDGRMLDFGTIGHVPGYRRQARAANYPEQWGQAVTIVRVLREWRWHVEKYLEQSTDGLIPERELVRQFDLAYRRANEMEMLKMAGFSAGFLRRYPGEQRRRLFTCLLDIYRCGARESYSEEAPKPATRSEAPPIAQLGSYNLNAILATAAVETDTDLDQGLAPLLPDRALRRRFVDAYVDCRSAYVAQYSPELRDCAQVYLALQAQRRNANLDFLIRGNTFGTTPGSLTQRLRRFDAVPDGVGAFIDSTVTQGRRLLQDLHPDLPGSFAYEQIEAIEAMGAHAPIFVTDQLESLGVDRARAQRVARALSTQVGARDKVAA